jgi:hypothetical protein
MKLVQGLITILVIAVIGAGTAAAQDRQGGQGGQGGPSDQCFAKGGMFDTEQQKCDIKTGIEIDIKYPLEVTTYPFVEQTADAFLADTRNQYISDFASMGADIYSPASWGLYIDYEISQFSPDVLSLKFTISDYTGGAHGNSYFQTYTFDLTQNRVLALGDLFQPGTDILGTLAPIVQQELNAEMGAYADPQWIQDGTSSLDAYTSFTVTPDALVFYFAPYQVAAYAAGPQTVQIPLAQISGVLAPPFNGAS